MAFEDELRLAYAVAINAFVFACAYHFVAARVGGDVIQRLIDALLLYYAVQYASIMLPGLLGALHPFSVAAVAGWLGVSLLTGAHFLRVPPSAQAELEARPLDRFDRYVTLACAAFVVAFVGALVHQQRYLPPFATDALTYHLPAAVQWLQTGRVGVFETWFFNPANTYSPLGGSTFIAWLLSPTQNHALARFVQVGPLLLLFLLLIEVARGLGASIATAAVVAAAAVMSRPFISQAIVPKDDLFVAAFAVAALLSLCGPRAGGRFAAWRAGGTIGLLLAMKYTVLFAAPILILAIDAPIRRWRGRDWLIACGVVLLFAGPWYVRNVWMTANPLYPMDVHVGPWHVLRGMFATAGSEDLRTFAGVRHVLTGGYYSVPIILAAVLIVASVAMMIRIGRDAIRAPLPRACVFGSVLSIVMFLTAAPFGEVRFLYPAIALLMACVAAAIAAWLKRPIVAVSSAGVIFIGALLTSGFPTEDKITFTIAGAIVASICLLSLLALDRYHRRARNALVLAAVAVLLVVTGFTYVHWRAYLEQLVVDEQYAWSRGYAELADAWAYVRRELPTDVTVAYGNTYFVYPLQGSELTRRAVYAPVRPGVERIADLPPLPGRIPGEWIVPLTVRETVAGADRDTWLANLDETGAGFLFIGKGGETPAPELAFAETDPSRFTRLFENESARIYRINTGSTRQP